MGGVPEAAVSGVGEEVKACGVVEVAVGDTGDRAAEVLPRPGCAGLVAVDVAPDRRLLRTSLPPPPPTGPFQEALAVARTGRFDLLPVYRVDRFLPPEQAGLLVQYRALRQLIVGGTARAFSMLRIQAGQAIARRWPTVVVAGVRLYGVVDRHGTRHAVEGSDAPGCSHPADTGGLDEPPRSPSCQPLSHSTPVGIVYASLLCSSSEV